MLIERSLAPLIKQMASCFPIVTIEGPRQSGKTTLAKLVFPDYEYVNLEDYEDLEMARRYPKDFFARHTPPLIIDEVQRAPEFLSAIQVESDRLSKPGMFVLTGSHQPRLKEGIAQSLAGRTALVTLLPLSISELKKAGITLNRSGYILKGGLPAVHSLNQPPYQAYQSYYRTYVEKDVRNLINLVHQREFEHFLHLLAGRIGQVVNLNSLSGDVGVSSTTLKEWLSLLEAGFVVFELPPYSANFGKRLVKSPKIYFCDPGLAASLLGLSSEEEVERDPLFGGLFENMVYLEALKARYNALKNPGLYFVREQTGLEVDLVLEVRRQLHLFEIKSALTPEDSMTKNMDIFSRHCKDCLSKNVVYSGQARPIEGGGSFLNFTDLGDLIANL